MEIGPRAKPETLTPAAEPSLAPTPNETVADIG